MIKFEHHTIDDIGKERWEELMMESFGEYDSATIPNTIIFIYDDDKLVGFQSVRARDGRTANISFTGFTKDAMPEKKFYYYKQTLAHLHEKGFPFISGSIHNENIIALRWALKSGFKIVGTRQAYTGEIFVEILRRADVVDPIIP